MIENLTLKFGRLPGAAPLTVQLTPVTVFVGPNNSGKSRALQEINQFCHAGVANATNVIVDTLIFGALSDASIEQKIDRVTLRPGPTEAMAPGHIIVGKRGARINLPRINLVNAMKRSAAAAQQFCQWYLAYNTLMLDGSGRIDLIGAKAIGDLQQPAQNSLQVLFRDDDKRSEVRQRIHEAFETHLVIDPTNVGHLRFRLSPRAPVNPMEERGLHTEAIAFHGQALPIEQASDGVKAFVGIITEIMAGDPAVILIDEPEAFLHPALAFTLGKEIAQASLGSEKRLFVSTHSPTFVMGCIQSGAPVNIIRLTYRAGIPTARILPSATIVTLMRNPLLRSTGVISALFYENVVVTESDADRAFYQEVNERLLRFKPELGIPNCLFLNAQNKQTVHTIVRPLRELGIPAATIVDIDVLKDGGITWTNFLNGGFVPEINRQALATERAQIKARFDALQGQDMKRDGGINLLERDDKESAVNLLDRLKQYGLFVVRSGELEAWLKHLGAEGHGPGWLISIFERMGDNPDVEDYIKPTDEDVWKFVGQIKEWLGNPRRSGIPE